MFGYVTVYKEELKIKEYNTYRSFYCGLCKQLKTEYGFSSRLILNYDSVFLALLLSSVLEEDAECVPERCIVHPVNKRPVRKPSGCLSYSAGVMLILALLKLSDNIKDDKSIKDLGASFLLLKARFRVKKKYGDLYKECKKHIDALSKLEKENCENPDATAHEFASILEKLFVPDFITDETQKRILSHLGYSLGRFIYLLDAYEDFEEDKKRKRYNPYLAKGMRPEKKAFVDSLTFTLSSFASSFELLNIKQNKEILDNIIYLGLPAALSRATTEKKENNNERSI